jgi:predicted RNA-binding protein with TRAM domain
MRALMLIGACVAGIALVLGFTTFRGGSAKAARPTLRIVHSKPAKVRGEHFRARETVQVTVGKQTLGTKASGDGTFVVTIPGASRCESTRVLARGSAGSYAIVKLLPSPECLPARTS